VTPGERERERESEIEVREREGGFGVQGLGFRIEG